MNDFDSFQWMARALHVWWKIGFLALHVSDVQPPKIELKLTHVQTYIYTHMCVCVQSSMIVCTHALCLGSRVAASLWCRPRARETLTNLWDSFQSGAESRPQYSIQYIARSNSTKARARDWFIKFSTAMFEDFARAIFVVRPQMSWSFPKQIT